MEVLYWGSTAIIYILMALIVSIMAIAYLFGKTKIVSMLENQLIWIVRIAIVALIGLLIFLLIFSATVIFIAIMNGTIEELY